MFKLIIKVFVIIGLLGVIAYASFCTYVNFIEPKIDSGQTELPDAPDARYELLIVTTGQLVFSDDMEQRGDTYILNGYWELIGDEYLYRDFILPLDKATWGDIIIRKGAE